MKKIFFTISFIGFLITTQAQTIGYDKGALLFSKENIIGTARFTGMSGAFGALGGNLSAADINPAGLVVFKNSEFSLTATNNNLTTDTSYFNTKTTTNNERLNISHVGAVLVFENNKDYWDKFAVSFNYTIVNDFENSYITRGNSGVAEFNADPFLNFDNDNTNDIYYDFVNSQSFINATSGRNAKGSFSIAGRYDKTLSYGFSIVTHSINYSQSIRFRESNNDINGNTLDATLNQALGVIGDGYGFNLGLIYKPKAHIRLGLAYESPTWYNITEEFQETTDISLSNTNTIYSEMPDFTFFDYRIKTANRITGSFAYIFGKKGLISIDYNRRGYSAIKVNPTALFNQENTAITEELQDTNEFRIGAEYRFKNLRFRTGFHTEDNPYKNINTKTEGYSAGLGILFSEYTSLDISYNKITSADNYSFLQNRDTNLNLTNSRISATITIKL